MNFGDALNAIKDGHRCQREGWNGKGMWIAYTAGSTIPGRQQVPADEDEQMAYGVEYEPHSGLRGAALLFAQNEEEPNGPEYIRLCPHVDFRAADGSLVIGWLASQTDMLATDWRVL